jgi:3-dehydroquinate dehydratase/shikimate dehydrogenase
MVQPMRIIASVVEPTPERVMARVASVSEVADGIEIRLDALGLSPAGDPTSLLTRILEATAKPIILTYRPREEGGYAEASLTDRWRLWSKVIAWAERREQVCARLLYDLEVDIAEMIRDTAPSELARSFPWERVIASHHRYDARPEEVAAMYERVSALPARIVKLAIFAHDIGDSLAIFRLLERARREKRDLVGVAMGTAGLLTRILGVAYGSAFTYGAAAAGREAAPGQIPVSDLRRLYRVGELGPQTVVVGVIGHPVGHSLSPLVHNTGFRILGLDFVYIPFEVARLDRFLRDFVHPGTRQIPWRLRGLSVTIPHKVAVLSFLDEVDPLAQRVGAVNTIVIEGERLLGYNTDVAGGTEPLAERFALHGARVAIVGAGGAARALAYGVRERGARVLLFGRRPERVRELADAIGAEAHTLEDLVAHTFDVVVNATPVGMTGYPVSEVIPEEALRHRPLVYDLVYTPLETPLLRRAKQMGCPVLSGIEMFLRQAAAQFRLWTGQHPPLDAMRASVYTTLS